VNLEFSKRAVADLRRIASRSREEYGDEVAQALERRIRSVTARVSRAPLSAQSIADRPGVHVVPLLRYPFKVFYRVSGDSVRILHIRHSSRQNWNVED
jgi:plasmid stabilization system protein ParE